MNVLFNSNNNNSKPTVNKSQTKEKNINYIAVFSNLKSNQNRYLSEKQRHLTKFNSQKKIKKKDNKTKNHRENKSNGILVSFNDSNSNNIKLKNYTNLLVKTSQGARNNKNTSQSLSKPKLEIEINNINSSNNNLGTNLARFSNTKRYKKNISEHDLVTNILNTFTNYNNSKGINIKLNFSSKKKLNNDNNNNNNNKIHQKCDTVNCKKQNKSNINKIRERARHSSETKLLRSSSGFSTNNHLAKTNSFFNNHQHYQLSHISTWCNNPEWTNTNFGNIVKLSTQKRNRNSKPRNSSNKAPIIGKIIKNYKNNDLNCIFNMNLMPPVTPLSNIQDYFKHLYKIEYNSESKENRAKKTNRKNKKDNDNNNEYKGKEEKGRDKDRDLRTKNNDDYSQSKNTMTKTNDISKIKREKDSIDNQKYCSDSPEEIHFYVITSIQNGKNMECSLIRK
jgi:hypothetical protein